MSVSQAPVKPTTEQLAAMALEKVRGICKGNGIKADAIKILSHTIGPQSLNAGTYLELKPVVAERSAPGKVMSGQMAGSRAEAQKMADQTMVQAAQNPATKAQIAGVLLNRPDQGFGLSRQAIPIDFLKKDFTWHEPCSSCRGSAQGPCQRCQGKRVEPCVKCSGRGLMMCPVCNSSGMVHGANCHRCNGQRYVPCDGCNRSGMMPCRTCNATGTQACGACGGQGFKSYIMSLTAQALTYFEYDAQALPKGAADAIETQASALAASKKIGIKGRIADDKENVLGASYEVEFPFGEIVFQVGKKEVKANLFGYQGDLMDFPLLLDKMLAPAVEDLEEAARGAGDVAGKIRKATRYRTLALAFIQASRTSQQKTIAALLRQYNIGLSMGMAEKIALLADTTTAHITRKPRLYGLLGGLGITAIINAVYYILPVRSAIASYLPDPRIDFILDVLPIILGSILTTMVIQASSAGAIRKALGHLFPKDKKTAMTAKAGSMAYWGYVGAVLLVPAMIAVAGSMGMIAPYWYQLVTSIIGL